MGYASDQHIEQIMNRISDAEWAEYERIADAEAAAEIAYWQEQQECAQVTQPAYLQAALAAGLSPYHHGRFAALSWLPCAADEYLMDGAQAEFVQGYREEARDRFAAMVKAMFGDEEYEAAIEHVEYVDAMEDEQWHSRGAW